MVSILVMMMNVMMSVYGGVDASDCVDYEYIVVSMVLVIYDHSLDFVYRAIKNFLFDVFDRLRNEEKYSFCFSHTTVFIHTNCFQTYLSGNLNDGFISAKTPDICCIRKCCF